MSGYEHEGNRQDVYMGDSGWLFRDIGKGDYEMIVTFGTSAEFVGFMKRVKRYEEFWRVPFARLGSRAGER